MPDVTMKSTCPECGKDRLGKQQMLMGYPVFVCDEPAIEFVCEGCGTYDVVGQSIAEMLNLSSGVADHA